MSWLIEIFAPSSATSVAAARAIAAAVRPVLRIGWLVSLHLKCDLQATPLLSSNVSLSFFHLSPFPAELLRGDTTNTPASDVYAFGIVMYEVFSRKEPYEGEDEALVLEDVVNPSINKRPTAPSNCPPQVAELMEDCLKVKIAIL